MYEEATPRNKTTIPPEEVVPFWPLSANSQKLVAMVTGDTDSYSAPFNYLRSDFTVLQFNKSKEVCTDIV